MAVTVQRVRELALALPGASEKPHFHLAAFHTPRKTFVTLDAAGGRINLMFDPELRDFYSEQEPQAFKPLPGGWGHMGCTLCDLQAVDEATLLSALQAAHRLAEPKPRRSRR